MALATRLPYRQAGNSLGGFLVKEIDHCSLHRWGVIKEGTAIITEEDDLQEAVFQHGVIPDRDVKKREIGLVEVASAFLRAQRKESDQFEVWLGVLTTCKELESVTAKNRRC